jgi:hypothetical protein
VLFTNYLPAQKLKAEDVADITKINALLNESFKKSGFNSSFECRYLDPKNASRYVLVAILEGSSDLLKMDYDMNKKNIDSGKKAIGFYNKLSLYEKAGSWAYYLTAPKEAGRPEAFLFKFTKGKYLVTFGTTGVPLSLVQAKLEDIYQRLIPKL